MSKNTKRSISPKPHGKQYLLKNIFEIAQQVIINPDPTQIQEVPGRSCKVFVVEEVWRIT
jgi:hypothetical protein